MKSPRSKRINDLKSPGISIVPLDSPVSLEKGADSVFQNHRNPHPLIIISDEVEGGKEIYQETNLDTQVGDPKGAGLPHILHECDSSHLINHMMDHISTDTNQRNQATNYVLEEEYCEIVI